jgi:hypothetical protein
VTRDVVPRIMAAQQAEAAFADLHFAQTAMVLNGGSCAADEDDLACVKASTRLRGTTDEGGRPRWPRLRRVQRLEAIDDKLYAASSAATPGYAEQTVAARRRGGRRRRRGHRALHHQANMDRAQADAKFAALETTTTRTTIVLGALALLAALILALGIGRH